MLLGDGTEPFNTVITFRLKGQFVLKEIQHAFERLQEKHPWLKAVITQDGNNIPWFEVSEKAKIPIRILAKRQENDWLEESRKEWYKLFNYKEQPLMRFVWIKGEETSDMMFVFHHCLCDGGSAMAVLDEFLQVLDDPLAEIGTENPILGIQDVVPVEILSSFGQKLKARTIGRLAANAIKWIPVNKKSKDRGRDYLIHWKLSEEDSQALVSFCKSAKITVNTFLSAALLQAFKNIKGEKAFNKVSCPVDIRRFAPQIKADHIFAFGLMIVLSSDQKLSFTENLKLIQKLADKKTSRLNPYIVMMVMESAHDALKNFTNLLTNGKSSNDCMFSNLGRIQIQHQYKEFSLETIFSPSVIGPLGNTTTMVTSTFRNEMDFTFMGSEGYLKHSDALAIRDEMIKIVKQQTELAEV